MHNDRKLFEFLLLEGAQAGLRWITVLKKRAAYRAAFDQFDPAKIARYRSARVRTLLGNPGIIRNRLKIESAISNAQMVLRIQATRGSFDRYIWQFVSGTPVRNARRALKQLPATTPTSDQMSRALQQAGFRFVGSTICYAFMQATGMVNDHLTSCFRYRQV